MCFSQCSILQAYAKTWSGVKPWGGVMEWCGFLEWFFGVGFWSHLWGPLRSEDDLSVSGDTRCEHARS